MRRPQVEMAGPINATCGSLRPSSAAAPTSAGVHKTAAKRKYNPSQATSRLQACPTNPLTYAPSAIAGLTVWSEKNRGAWNGWKRYPIPKMVSM